MRRIYCDSSSSRTLKLPSSLRVLCIDCTPEPSEPTPHMLADVFPETERLRALNTVGVRIVPNNIAAFGLFLGDLGSQLQNLELWIGSRCNVGAQFLFLIYI